MRGAAAQFEHEVFKQIRRLGQGEFLGRIRAAQEQAALGVVDDFEHALGAGHAQPIVAVSRSAVGTKVVERDRGLPLIRQAVENGTAVFAAGKSRVGLVGVKRGDARVLQPGDPAHIVDGMNGHPGDRAAVRFATTVEVGARAVELVRLSRTGEDRLADLSGPHGVARGADGREEAVVPHARDAHAGLGHGATDALEIIERGGDRFFAHDVTVTLGRLDARFRVAIERHADGHDIGAHLIEHASIVVVHARFAREARRVAHLSQVILLAALGDGDQVTVGQLGNGAGYVVEVPVDPDRRDASWHDSSPVGPVRATVVQSRRCLPYRPGGRATSGRTPNVAMRKG